MEQQSEFEKLESQLSQTAINYLKETAKWAKFLSIVGFVFLGLLGILSFSMIIGFSSMSRFGSGIGAGLGVGMGFAYFLIIALYFFPIYFLYKFSAKTKQALETRNNAMLTEGLENLKSHYKFIGILTIIVLSFYALAIALGGLGALFAS